MNDLAQNEYHKKMLKIVKGADRLNKALSDCRITCIGLFAETYVAYLTLQEDAAKLLQESPEKCKKYWLRISVNTYTSS